jgi:hypothetical protein
MLGKFGDRLFPGISIPFLKDAYGPFLGAVGAGNLIVAAFIPRLHNVLAKFIPIRF